MNFLCVGNPASSSLVDLESVCPIVWFHEQVYWWVNLSQKQPVNLSVKPLVTLIPYLSETVHFRPHLILMQVAKPLSHPTKYLVDFRQQFYPQFFRVKPILILPVMPIVNWLAMPIANLLAMPIVIDQEISMVTSRATLLWQLFVVLWQISSPLFFAMIAILLLFVDVPFFVRSILFGLQYERLPNPNNVGNGKKTKTY